MRGTVWRGPRVRILSQQLEGCTRCWAGWGGGWRRLWQLMVNVRSNARDQPTHHFRCCCTDLKVTRAYAHILCLILDLLLAVELDIN